MPLRIISFFSKILLILFVISGCTSSQVSTLLLGSVAYTVWTDKLPTDTVLAALTGKDCSTVRAEEQGGEVCQPKNPDTPRATDVPQWCYSNIAGVDCYAHEIPQYADRLLQ